MSKTSESAIFFVYRFETFENKYQTVIFSAMNLLLYPKTVWAVGMESVICMFAICFTACYKFRKLYLQL